MTILYFIYLTHNGKKVYSNSICYHYRGKMTLFHFYMQHSSTLISLYFSAVHLNFPRVSNYNIKVQRPFCYGASIFPSAACWGNSPCQVFASHLSGGGMATPQPWTHTLRQGEREFIKPSLSPAWDPS